MPEFSIRMAGLGGGGEERERDPLESATPTETVAEDSDLWEAEQKPREKKKRKKENLK